MRTLLAAAVAGSAILAVSIMPALAGNWGAGSWGGQSIACIAESKKSECTAENSYETVYIAGGTPTVWENALVASMQQDYTFSGFTMVHDTSFDQFTDAYVIPSDIPSGPYWLYTTCPTDASHNGGTGYYEYCKPQALRFDERRPDAQADLSNPAKVAWLSCHELGHLTGLQHAGGSGAVSSTRDTCMEYEQHPGLDAHDREHLVDCYPRPSPYLYNLTDSCRLYGQ